MPSLADLQQPVNRPAREYAATSAAVPDIPYLYGYRQQVDGSIPGVDGSPSIGGPAAAGGGRGRAIDAGVGIGNLPAGAVGGSIGGATLGGAGTIPEPVGINAADLSAQAGQLAEQYGGLIPDQLLSTRNLWGAKNLMDGGEGAGEKGGVAGVGTVDRYGMVDTLSFFQNQLLSSLPIPGAGALVAAGGVASRMNNMAAVNNLRQQLGISTLNIGQYIGGILGLNDYGTGYVGDVTIDGKSYGVHRGGITSDMFGNVTTMLTPEEAFARQERMKIAEKLAAQQQAKLAAEEAARQEASRRQAERAAANDLGGGAAYGGPSGNNPGSIDLGREGSFYDPSYGDLGIGISPESWNDAVSNMTGDFGGSDGATSNDGYGGGMGGVGPGGRGDDNGW